MENISVAIFKNEKKTKDSHPDASGYGSVSRDYIVKILDIATEHGLEEIPLEVAAWKKTSKNGNDFFSTSIRVNMYRIENKPSPNSKTNSNNSDVPF